MCGEDDGIAWSHLLEEVRRVIGRASRAICVGLSRCVRWVASSMKGSAAAGEERERERERVRERERGEGCCCELESLAGQS